jgi:predicted ATP-binding protein involved in virulence
LFDDGIELINAEEWLQRLDYSRLKKSAISDELAKQFDLVRATLLDILPDVDDIQISPPSKEHPNPRVLFTTPYGDVQLRQLGFGYQSLISWVVDFAARMFDAYPDSPNPLTEPAVCLVDEIDLHLHPSWQRKVMRYLSDRFPKTQFIATAHSPLIVQAAPEIGANVVVLRRVGDHVVISNNPIDVHGWRADQILSSELFENQPLRSPDIQAAMDERTSLLSKQKLTAKDQRRIAELDVIVDSLPIGSTSEERTVANQLKAAAAMLDRVTSRKP